MFKEALEEFLMELEIKNYSKKTIISYHFNNNQLMKWLELELKIIEIDKVKVIHLKKYIHYLQETKHKPSYVNRIIKCLRAFFRYATNEEIIKENPTLKLSWMKEQKIIINTFTDQEVYKMMNVYKGNDFINLRNRCVMALFLDTGIRCMELRNIKDKDIRGDTLLIEHGKGNKDRFIALSPYTRKIIIKYQRARNQKFTDRVINEDTNLILSTYFLPISETPVERVVKVCGEKAGVRKEIRCSPHDCRHYFAQKQLRLGNDVYSVSRLLGHENTQITIRYLRSIQDADIISKSIKTSPLMNMRK